MAFVRQIGGRRRAISNAASNAKSSLGGDTKRLTTVEPFVASLLMSVREPITVSTGGM
jgi:hypothetical protein